MSPFGHFDLLAPFYDRLIATPDGQALRALAALPTAGRLLDVGGGTGRVAQGLVGSVPKIIIVDASLRMLRQAQVKDGLQTVVGLSERLPFPDGAFERVVMVDAFHHLGDQSKSLAEMWRVLAPGGRLVIEEPDVHRFAVKLVALAERLALMRSHFVEADRIATELHRLGAQTSIHHQDHTAWVVARKPSI